MAVAGAWAIPWISRGSDIYAHLVWTHQAMRCLAAGQLPLWAPDMNAGFGSPGIRLYSPATPALAAVLGLPPGDAAAGLRAALALAVVALAAVASRREHATLMVGVVVLSGPVMAALWVSAAWGHLLALPLVVWMLERWTAAEDPSGPIAVDAVALAVLWLLHALSAAMTVALLAVAAVLRERPLLAVARLAGALGVGAALTAWHWLPLAGELRLTSGHRGLTEGIFDVARNWLGSPTAHMPALNRAQSAAAVVLGIVALAVVAVSRRLPSRERRARLGVVGACLALSSVAAVPLVRLGLPLDWIQFPWRWLTPAVAVMARPLAAAVRHRPSWLLLWLAPLIVVPWVAPVRAPHLGPRVTWPEAGQLVTAIDGNPLLVDVIEHRPPWYDGLAAEIQRFGGRRVVTEPPGPARVVRWRPLDREVDVVAAEPSVVRLRLMRYPGWELTVDGRPAAPLGDAAAVAVPVGPGAHRLRARWRGNPLAGTGLALAAAAALGLALLRARRCGGALLSSARSSS